MSAFDRPVAVVDIGSVSTQLLITDGDRRLQRTVDTLMGGSSLSTTGRLRGEPVTPEALDRVGEALAGFAELIAGNDARPIRVVGTAAARRATNRGELDAVVRRHIGAPLEVLADADEARLSFSGAVSDADLALGGEDGTVVTIDIGGGSTEFATGTGERPLAGHSIPIGGALLTATYLTSDPPRPEELSAALSVIELHIDDVHRELPQLGPTLPVATTVAVGAATTIAAIEIGLADTDHAGGAGDGPVHGFKLTRAAVEDVFRTIATESREDRAFNPGLPLSRVDDIVGACALLVEVMRRFDLPQVIVSERGLMDGVAIEMLGARG